MPIEHWIQIPKTCPRYHFKVSLSRLKNIEKQIQLNALTEIAIDIGPKASSR